MNAATLDRKPPTVGMSQIVFLEQPETAHSVFGSCIALTLFHARMKLGAIAHIVLPRSSGREGQPGKFADTAIPYMLTQLTARGARGSGLVPKLCGGASMFGGGPIQIGEENVTAVEALLKEARIPIVGRHLGGKKGRRVTFDCATGDATIEIVGQPAEVI
ncbi:MAG TPA: chemotaxis protein CheD [Fuerstia sp.]|nr:chemotaxis protein CheD [Fuerstiella sp.]